MEPKAIIRKKPPIGTAIKARKLYSVEMLQKRQKRLISGDSPSTSLLPKVTPNLSKNQILIKLRDMTGVTCASNSDKFQLLRRRDELMSKLREMDSGPAGTRQITQGTCSDMCPEKERYMRDVKKSVHPYECDSKGQMVHEKMVKDYSRSAADQDMPLEHELRPLDALQTSMDYLIFNIANEIPKTNAELARWYDFLWSRTRAIRKDITQQMLQNESAVDLVEKCVRLHIFASFRLGFLDTELFDHRINTENLSKSMQTLRHMYEDLAKRQHFCPNEAEFRSYDVILNFTDFNVYSQVLAYRTSVLESPEVQLALSLATSLQNNNFVRFFRLVRYHASFLQACLCYQFFTSVRTNALKAICQAYRNLPMDTFVANLSFDSLDQALTFLRAHHVELDDVDPNLLNTLQGRNQFQPNAEKPIASLLTQMNCAWIEEKATNLTLPQILCNNPLASRPPDAKPQQLVNSFSPNTNAYVNDPVLKKLLESNGIAVPAVSSANLLKPMKLELDNNGYSSTEERQSPIRERQQQKERHQQNDVKPTIAPTSFSFARAIAHLQEPRQQPVPIPILQFQPSPKPKFNAAQFVASQSDFLLNHVLHCKLNVISFQCMKLAKIRENLRKEWLRSFFRRWISYAKRRRQLRLVEHLAQTLLDEIVQNHTQTASRGAYRHALEQFRQNATLSLVNEMQEKLFTEQLQNIASRVQDTQMRDIEQRQNRMREKWRLMWLRQFTDHWLSVTRRNRRLRSISFLTPPPAEPGTSALNAAAIDGDGGRLSSPTKRFFRPGLKKLTPEQMQQMAEEKLRQMEETERRRAEAEQELEVRLVEGGHDEIGQQMQISPAAVIRDQILDGVSFKAESPTSGFSADSASKLHLFNPGKLRFTPDCMRQMLERKLQQQRKQERMQQRQQQNGHPADLLNGEDDNEEEEEDIEELSPQTSSTLTTTTGPIKRRRFF